VLRRIRDKGFTLVEILAVLVLIGVLLLIAIPAINKQLANFRVNYYKKLEESIESSAKDYILDRRFSKPTDLLHSKVIMVSELEEKGYIDSVKDYLGKTCDNTETSYSYVVMVKTGEKEYEYQTCLKCSQDEYATDTSEEEKDYCNIAWLENNNITYENVILNQEFMYVYYGTTEAEIKEQVGMKYDVTKKDDEGKVLTTIKNNSNSEKDIVYPQNLGQLVGANVNSKVNLIYTLPDGEKLEKEAVIYRHNAPKIETSYASNNTVSLKNSGDRYGYGADEWASSLKVEISFSDEDITIPNVRISGAEYYDAGTKKWYDTGCQVSDGKCIWYIRNNFDKDIKVRLVSNNYLNGEKNLGLASSEYSINVDATTPECGSNNGSITWAKSRSVTQYCSDSLSGCNLNPYTESYPTSTIRNMKMGNITIYDKAGNSTSCPVNFYVDSTPPTCDINLTNSSGVVASTSNSDVTIAINSTDSETNASGTSSTTWNLFKDGTNLGQLSSTNNKSNGTYTVNATCRDNAGNQSTSSKTFTLNKTITITFHSNGGSGTMANQTCNKGASCTLSANAYSRVGYQFNGWNTKADGSGTSYTNSGSVTLSENITLYAQWKLSTPGGYPAYTTTGSIWLWRGTSSCKTYNETEGYCHTNGCPCLGSISAGNDFYVVGKDTKNSNISIFLYAYVKPTGVGAGAKQYYDGNPYCAVYDNDSGVPVEVDGKSLTLPAMINFNGENYFLARMVTYCELESCGNASKKNCRDGHCSTGWVTNWRP